MTPEKKDKKEKKSQSAEEVAKTMAENMKANMENPNFWNEKEELTQRTLNKVLRKREERRKANNEKV